MTKILGISSFYHDSAAALIVDGIIINAVQEERFTRIKHDSAFPAKSIEFMLKTNKLSLSDIDYVTFYEKPIIKFDRILETNIYYSPEGIKSFLSSMPLWIKDKLFQKNLLIKELKKFDTNFNSNKLLFSEHHLSHAASAFYASPFDNAIILTIDGVGEWSTTTLSLGKKNKIEIKKEINFPNSLGLLYSSFTQFLGLKVNSAEYKLMGLAPYGNPIYKEKILTHLIDVKEDGSFRLNQSYFDYCKNLSMINKKFEKLFNHKRRMSENEPLDSFHTDIAASIQSVLDEIVIKIVNFAFKKYKVSNLVMSGGVALNCVTNSKVLKQKLFKNIWVQPASGDAGCAVGSALSTYYDYLQNSRITNNNNDLMQGSYLGLEPSNDEVDFELKKLNAVFEVKNFEYISKFVSKEIANGKIIGWFQGKAEFGPRALGNRSILADPRNKDMQKNLNLKIKYRESFRPFAPSILEEFIEDWFDFDSKTSPYMMFTADVKNTKQQINRESNDIINQLYSIKSNIPAVTHVDNSARLQTVSKKNNIKFYNLINDFRELTGCPILINTSFNVRGEPIVNSPSDAFRCFMGTGIDILVINNFILKKEDQIKIKGQNYADNFIPD